jgi:hypothetical protein
MLKKAIKLLSLSLVAVLVSGVVTLHATDSSVDKKGVRPIQKTKKIDSKKIGNSEMPPVSNDGEKIGATGYHCDDCDEPTQERPNPIDSKKAKKKAADLQQR